MQTPDSSHERPEPDYRDYLEIGTGGGGGDDDSSWSPKRQPHREVEDATVH
jgi:hypothetical protein